VEAPPADALVVAITGDDFRWHYRYPGEDDRLGTGDDVHATGDLHLPAHRHVLLRLTSEDYLYTFSLPELSKTEAAIPDLEMTLELATGDPGVFELRGDQFCGYSHEGLTGKMIVQEPDELRAWMQRANETEPTS
jgi:cytochrome c oxidase subunit 2